MIELVAITDDAAPVDPPLRAVRSGGLSVLCAPAARADATPELLWRRDALLERLMEQRDVLPIRFGTLVPDERAAERALAERSEEFAAGLDRVRGAVELALRVQPREPEAGGGETGHEYLRGKLERAALARRLHEPLAARARAAVLRPGPELLRAAYLVDRRAVDGFVAAVTGAQQAHPELALLCTGPWPPYSFAQEAGPP